VPTKVLAMFVLAVVAGFALASCGGEGDGELTRTQTQTTEGAGTTQPPPTSTISPKMILVRIEDGVPVRGVERVTVRKGDRVIISVFSDVADELHVHGYDVSRDLQRGRAVALAFTADVPGRFEVELEERGVQIAELTVEP